MDVFLQGNFADSVAKMLDSLWSAADDVNDVIHDCTTLHDLLLTKVNNKPEKSPLHVIIYTNGKLNKLENVHRTIQPTNMKT